MMAVADVKEKQAPVGLGGWLILPILGFAATFLLTGLHMAETFKGSTSLWKALSATRGPLTQLKAPLAADVVFGTAVMVSAAYCLYLVARKRRSIMIVAPAHYGVLALAAFADGWMSETLRAIASNVVAYGGAYDEIYRAIVMAIIWIPYFREAPRVRNTFVN